MLPIGFDTERPEDTKLAEKHLQMIGWPNGIAPAHRIRNNLDRVQAFSAISVSNPD